jgi:hypothetical protein
MLVVVVVASWGVVVLYDDVTTGIVQKKGLFNTLYYRYYFQEAGSIVPVVHVFSPLCSVAMENSASVPLQIMVNLLYEIYQCYRLRVVVLPKNENEYR